MGIFARVWGLVFSFLLLVNLPLWAAPDIRYHTAEAETQEIIVREEDKLFLDKTWYDYKFEVKSGTSSGSLKMQQVDAGEYAQALQQVSIPLDNIGSYQVYFLDRRLKDYTTAQALSFPDGSVVVFGTYYPLAQAKVHQLAVHELGHQVDFALMTPARWEEYRRLRGLTDSQKYDNASPVYENRPQEIFAEDFRLLFGGEQARRIPHLNKFLPHPAEVQGLQEFMLKLVTAP